MGKPGITLIKVMFGSTLREIAGMAELEVVFPGSVSLGELLRYLGERFGPEIMGQGKEYQWRHGAAYVIAVVDGQAIDPAEWETFSLRGRSLVYLVPPLAGG